jgi:hypothetical protein
MYYLYIIKQGHLNNKTMNYEKLASRKPNNTFYKTREELIKGEFPMIDEQYNQNGLFNNSKFNQDFEGIDIMTFLSRANFITTAMGWHHLSYFTESLDQE